MDEATIHEVRQWLHKAEHDLRSAVRLMSGEEEPLLDTAVYHCQQAAEKALKAYLTAHGIMFPQIHLLSPLLSLCGDIDSSFLQLSDAAELLTPLATEFRYPGDILEPEPSDADEAYRVQGSGTCFKIRYFEIAGCWMMGWQRGTVHAVPE